MGIEKLMSKYTKATFSGLCGVKKSFKKQMKDLKMDKHANSKNKLTSIGKFS